MFAPVRRLRSRGGRLAVRTLPLAQLASREASIARMKKANEGAGGVSKENSFTFMLQLKASISKEAALRKQVQDEASEVPAGRDNDAQIPSRSACCKVNS